jgi:hypothetical protein
MPKEEKNKISNALNDFATTNNLPILLCKINAFITSINSVYGVSITTLANQSCDICPDYCSTTINNIKKTIDPIINIIKNSDNVGLLPRIMSTIMNTNDKINVFIKIFNCFIDQLNGMKFSTDKISKIDNTIFCKRIFVDNLTCQDTGISTRDKIILSVIFSILVIIILFLLFSKKF